MLLHILAANPFRGIFICIVEQTRECAFYAFILRLLSEKTTEAIFLFWMFALESPSSCQISSQVATIASTNLARFQSWTWLGSKFEVQYSETRKPNIDQAEHFNPQLIEYNTISCKFPNFKTPKSAKSMVQHHRVRNWPSPTPSTIRLRLSSQELIELNTLLQKLNKSNTAESRIY